MNTGRGFHAGYENGGTGNHEHGSDDPGDISEFVPERAAATTMSDAGLEALRLGGPPARGLPLLAALGRGASATVAIDYLSSAHLRVSVDPC